MIQFIEGFDHWDDGNELYKWDAQAGNVTVTSGTVQGVSPRRATSKFLYVSTGIIPTYSYITKNLSEFGPTVIFGYAFARSEACTSCQDHVRLGNAGGQQISITDDCAEGRIHLSCGAISAWTPSELFGYDEWIHIQVKVTLANSGGSYEVKVNEVTRLSGTGDTLSQASATITYFQFRTRVSNNTCMIDDLWILDGTDSGISGNPLNDFLGDCRVDALYPNAPGTYTQFSPSAGANYECVDDTTNEIIPKFATIDDDATYVESYDQNDRDSYNIHNLPSLDTTIYGIASNACARKTDAGLRKMRIFTRSGGTNYDGTHVGEIELSDNYKVYQEIWEGDPDTGNAWTESGINALETGVRITQ